MPSNSVASHAIVNWMPRHEWEGHNFQSCHRSAKRFRASAPEGLSFGRQSSNVIARNASSPPA